MVKFTTKGYYTPESTETIELTTQKQFEAKIAVAVTMKTAYFNDVQIVRNGHLLMKAHNQSTELMEYLNGQRAEF